MRRAEVYRNSVLAGILTESDDRTFEFRYDSSYFIDTTKPGISLTLPKKQMVYTANHLFPFFYNMLSEGSNRSMQLRHLKIDKKDFFSLLMAIAQYDTIGAITIKQLF